MRGDDIEFPFELVSDVETSNRERYRFLLQEYLVAPVKIIAHDRRALIGGAIVVGYLIVALLGPEVISYPYENEGPRYLAPFQELSMPLGTDRFGADIFAQLVHATPNMFKMILSGAVLSAFLGTSIGTVTGYKGGFVDRALMSITDIVLMIPGLPLVVILAGIIQPRDPLVVGIILGIDNWPGLARTVRSQVLALRDESFIEASRTLGLSTRTIITKDVLPGIMPYVLINMMTGARRIIFESVGLYFLGILPFTGLNWGVMLNSAYNVGGALYTWQTFHWFLFPLLTIIFLSLGLILLSQGMDRLFNPQVRARHVDTGDDASRGDS